MNSRAAQLTYEGGTVDTPIGSEVGMAHKCSRTPDESRWRDRATPTRTDIPNFMTGQTGMVATVPDGSRNVRNRAPAATPVAAS